MFLQAFEAHIAKVYESHKFKETAKAAQPFFSAIRDYVFGRPTTLENAWNIYDYMNTQLTYNQSYAHRLPPTLIEQARGLANFHENAVFSSEEAGGIGNCTLAATSCHVELGLIVLAFSGWPYYPSLGPRIPHPHRF